MSRDPTGPEPWEDESAEEDEAYAPLFEEGQPCDLCGASEGRVGIDPTCQGEYDGAPEIACYRCLGPALRRHYEGMEGIAVVVEPAPGFDSHDYYRVDELREYDFLLEDIDTISWLLLGIGGDCDVCRKQSHVLWLPADAIDSRLPDDAPMFVNPGAEGRFLCGGCVADALTNAYRASERRLLQVETPRAAMGVLVPATTD